ncbi:MAG: succinylglutamate desuccinylase/aspartoacylase family protein [Cyclobacteriaceae bacterium]
MPKIFSKALNTSISTDRIIGKMGGEGPCVVFFGGIHGNEPSGVFALKQVFEELERSQVKTQGQFIGLAGNLWALERNERFQHEDLNRMWNSERIQAMKEGNFHPKTEDEKQQLSLFSTLVEIINNHSGPYYFFDLHTTSSETTPFLTVNDSLLNRQFCEQYPVPMILGIEEYLDGPLLSYLNEEGYVSFGFESGQHDELSSINNHVSFIYLSLVFAGVLDASDINFQHHLASIEHSNSIYEIFHRHQLSSNESFQMTPGFSNFERVKKGTQLAVSNGVPIIAAENTTLFMPLYQPKGEDGYFEIRVVPKIFLRLSTLFRLLRLDRILPYLPGISWTTSQKESLKIDLKIARFLAKSILHLMGYRSKTENGGYLIAKNREARSRSSEYKGARWL